MFIPHYLGMLHTAETQLAESFQQVADRHYNEFEIRQMCQEMAGWSKGHIEALAPVMERYGEQKVDAPAVLRSSLFHGSRAGDLGLLHDLQDLGLLTNAVRTDYTILQQAAASKKDHELEQACINLGEQTNRQIEWICTQIKQRSPQVLNVPPDLDTELKASVPKKPSLAAMPEQIWSPLVASGLILAVGLFSLVVGRPMLFPSLGPSAYLTGEMTAHPTTRWYNTIAGHAIGLLAGFAAVFLFNAFNDPNPLVDKQLTLARALAAVLAVALTVFVGYLARASHPPAGATTLLVALGSIKTFQDALNLMLGAILLALLAEMLRRLRIGKVAVVKGEPHMPAPGTGK